MGLLSEAAKFGKPALPQKQAIASGLDPEAAVALICTAERGQQLETAWSAMLRTTAGRIETQQARGRRIEIFASLIGGAGLIGVVAAQFYRIIPYEYAFIATMIGVVLSAAPIFLTLWPGLKENQGLKTTLLDNSARAQSHAFFSRKMVQAVEQTRLHAAWAAESRKPLEWLLDGLEAEAGKFSKEMGIAGIEGRKHRRIVPRQRKVMIKTRDGRALTGQIADISLSGVALSEQLPRVALKDEVRVNGRDAVIVRIWDSGVALEFKQHLSPETFNEDLVL